MKENKKCTCSEEHKASLNTGHEWDCDEAVEYRAWLREQGIEVDDDTQKR